MSKKYVQSHVKEFIDTQTGEVQSIEVEKVITKTVQDSDTFYFTFIEYVAPLFNIRSKQACDLLRWMMCHAEYNTGRVTLNMDDRKEICQQLGILNSNLSKLLKMLSERKIISGEKKATYIINPSIFWKGTLKLREELLKDHDICVSFGLKKRT